LLDQQHYTEYYHDDKVVVIYDKFPKAKFHLLAMPHKLVDGPEVLTTEDLPMLADLKERGQIIIAELTKKRPKAKFRMGFHAVPSMRQLHMHIISQDFDSECLKNKKHWNSFTTEFFIDADDFIDKLRNENTIKYDHDSYEAILKREMVCHNCGEEMKNIPKVKQHISTCL